MIKGKLIELIRQAVIERIPRKLEEIGNGILKRSFPREIKVYKDYYMSTGLRDTFTVFDNHLAIPFDGTIFPIAEGYTRLSSTPEMPSYNPEGPKEFDVFISPYIATSLADVLNRDIYTMTGSVKKIKYDLVFDPSQNKTVLEYIDGDIILTVCPIITFHKNNTIVYACATARITPTVLDGDDEHMFILSSKIVYLNVNTIKTMHGGKVSESDDSADLLNTMVEEVLEELIVPDQRIKKLKYFHFQVSGDRIELSKGDP